MIKQEDINCLKALRAVIHSGDYKVKGDAIIKVALLLKWLDEFEKKLEKLNNG